jgi:N-acetylmuramoyl-L-alanine amidase
MNVITQLIPTNRQTQRPGLRLEPTFITVHSTGNPNSTAKNEADYVCYNSKRQASYHYVVGETEIFQVLPTNEVGWHAGDGYNGTGNRKSIGIEIIETGNREKVLLNTIELVKYLMSTFNIALINVVPHRHWSKKNCPRILIDPVFIKNNQSSMGFPSCSRPKIGSWAHTKTGRRIRAGAPFARRS